MKYVIRIKGTNKYVTKGNVKETLTTNIKNMQKYRRKKVAMSLWDRSCYEVVKISEVENEA